MAKLTDFFRDVLKESPNIATPIIFSGLVLIGIVIMYLIRTLSKEKE